MSLERARELVHRWRRAVDAHRLAERSAMTLRDPRLGTELLESMLLARHLDVAAHELRAAGHGHYTICSAGHEGNVVLGRLSRPTDPTLLHYRSAALQIERARQAPSVDAVLDVARSLVASSEDPISGGRHKVFGSRPLGIIPQTSTIASHLPRAVGLGYAIGRRRSMALKPDLPADSIAIVSFGDASINHSTALGAFNAAGWSAHGMLAVPLLFVCEDNGLGISVRSPPGWVATRLRALPHIEYFHADGTDLHACWVSARAAIEHCRKRRRPAILHLECVRLLGHAGSDVDTGYRSAAELDAARERDPVLLAALALIDAGALTKEQALKLDETASRRVREATERAIAEPKLSSREQVLEPIATKLTTAAAVPPATETPPMTLAQGINTALREALERHPELFVLGEDVAIKGGVYGVTKGLRDAAGPSRVFDTLLDEQTILGVALGAATLGFLPVPEIQYLAYLHNAEDQLRGEAATQPFFSRGAYDNPMIVRIAGFAYQKGFGGHFHNDNSLAVLRDVPGLVVAVPARADDALELFRAALALTRRARRVVVIVEPIARYHTRDLYEEGDRGWLSADTGRSAAIGKGRVYHPRAADLTIATYGNGVFLSLRAARRLAAEHDIHARVLDIRWIAPLASEEILEQASETGRLLFVDECRKSGNVSEAIAALVVDSGAPIRFRRVTAADCFVPLGEAADLVLVSEDEVVEGALALVR